MKRFPKRTFQSANKSPPRSVFCRTDELTVNPVFAFYQAEKRTVEGNAPLKITSEMGTDRISRLRVEVAFFLHTVEPSAVPRVISAMYEIGASHGMITTIEHRASRQEADSLRRLRTFYVYNPNNKLLEFLTAYGGGIFPQAVEVLFSDHLRVTKIYYDMSAVAFEETLRKSSRQLVLYRLKDAEKGLKEALARVDELQNCNSASYYKEQCVIAFRILDRRIQTILEKL